VIDNESLQALALLCQLVYPLLYSGNEFPANSVLTTGVVIGCVLLPSDELIRVKEVTILSGTDFI
jgi:hypothetical protein